jgi:transposase
MTLKGREKRRVIDEVAERSADTTVREVADHHNVSRSSVYRWKHMQDEGISLEPCRKRRRKEWSSVRLEHVDLLIEFVRGHPNCYLREVAAHMAQETGIEYGTFQIHRAISKQQITTKIMQLYPIERSGPLRLFFSEQVQLTAVSPRMLVFMDESHCRPSEFRRKYGRATKGKPAFMFVPNVAHGEGQAVSGVCAMGLNGILSVNTINGEITGDIFLRLLETEILPKMRPYPQDNSVLILDNASTHNHGAIFALANAYGVIVLFLPPYSFDFNPLEPVFHEAKHYLRSNYGEASFHVKERLFEALAQIPIEHCVNYFNHLPYINQISDQDREWALSFA